MNRIIVAVTGMPASRKSLFAKKLARLSYEHIMLSALLKQQLGLESENMDPAVFWKASLQIRKKGGEEILAKVAWEQMVDRNISRAVIDGIRCIPELLFLKKQADLCCLVGIHASPKMRHKRLMESPHGYYANNIERVAQLEAHELKLGTGDVFALSDEMILLDDNMNEDGIDVYLAHQASEIHEKILLAETGSNHTHKKYLENVQKLLALSS